MAHMMLFGLGVGAHLNTIAQSEVLAKPHGNINIYLTEKY
jgi:hypothetical protein